MRARKNIYERLIGILVHSNNCCAHISPTKITLATSVFFLPLIVRQYCVYSRRKTPPCPSLTQFLVLPRGVPEPHPHTLPPTTTETQLERTVRGNEESSKRGTNHALRPKSSRIPLPPNTAHAPGSRGGGKMSSWQTQLPFSGLHFRVPPPNPPERLPCDQRCHQVLH